MKGQSTQAGKHFLYFSGEGTIAGEDNEITCTVAPLFFKQSAQRFGQERLALADEAVPKD